MRSMRDISLTQLAYFERCAELSSMTEAAASLHIAQSAISTSIANLERRLGTQLFIRRRSKGLLLTSAGETFLVRVRQILADLDDAVAAVDPANVAGKLRVGVFPTLAPFYVPEIAQRLAQAHPGLTLEFVELSAGGLEAALKDHAIEVGLTYDLGLSPAVRHERLRQVPLYVAVGPDHRLADRDRVRIADLVEEPMVLLDLPHSRDYFTEVFTRFGFAPLVRYRFTSFEAVRAMVARGQGFTLLNQRPVFDLTYDGGRLIVVELDEDLGSLNVVLASIQPVESLSRRAQTFVDQCRAVITQRPGEACAPEYVETTSAVDAPSAETTSC